MISNPILDNDNSTTIANNENNNTFDNHSISKNYRSNSGGYNHDYMYNSELNLSSGHKPSRLDVSDTFIKNRP